MPSLTTPIGKLQAHYGVVVVGSGYGASVAACRMAELAQSLARPDTRDGASKPTFSVCVLERGLEIPSGDYPATLGQVARQMQVDSASGHLGSRTALFDFRLNSHISALVGCGLGGGSLINAGVMLPPPESVFKEGWPTGITFTDLEPYFNEVRGELGVSRLPREIELLKLTRLFDAANVKQEERECNRPEIAVSFETRVNRHGVQRKTCVLCGDCMAGCNHSAKNTLVTNYLPAAANAGALIFCRMDVRAIERRHDRWHIYVRVLDRAFHRFGSPELTIQADAVFLGAGTLGSVEILLRSKKRKLLSLSSRLGERFSGNGDVIAFAYNAAEPVNGFGYGSYVPPDATVGPLIAGMIDERTQSSGALIQEGTVPGALTPLLRFAAPFMARVSRRPIDLSGTLRFRYFRRELDTMLRGARHGALRRTQTFLGMGRDNAAGVMHLSGDRLRIRWPRRLDADDSSIRAITDRMKALTVGMKARYLVNPFWSRVFGRRRVTVHPLGGARMSDRAEDGVVNVEGAVFSGAAGTDVHPRLYVCDGAVVPVSLGTNPALTISALAERIAHSATNTIRTLKLTEQFGVDRVRPSVPGIHYAERLRGHLCLDGEKSRFTMVLHISAESLRDLIKESNTHHAASVVGILTAHQLHDGRRRFAVSNGTFNVMVDDTSRVDSKLIRYTLPLTAADNRQLTLTGQKAINHDTVREKGFWRVVSSYDFDITDAEGVKVGSGSASAGVLDTIRMVTSMRITHERGWIDRQVFKSRYRWFFVKSLFRVVGRSLDPRVNPLAGEERVKLPPDIQENQDRKIKDDKRLNPRFELTSYSRRGLPPDKGAVILAPGFGMSTYAFRLENSLMAHLCREGYEVWLFDYRASDSLAASLEQFTLDDLAIGDGTLEKDGVHGGTISGDFPDAIRRVVEKNHREPVKIVAHCVASLTMFMSLLAGTITSAQVKSVILSQSFACIDHPWINRFKAWIRLPQFLRYMRFMTVMTPDYDLRSGWRSRMLDRLLRLYPTHERCSSGVCRRLLLMYGEVIRHDQLDKTMHDRLYQLFDRANMTTFVHLSRMIAKGHIVDSKGRNSYLTPENTRRIEVPITLLQGSGNRLFRPRGAERTLAWLHKHGRFGPDNKTMFQLKYVPKHGHLDTFIGKHAAAEVHDIITTLLREQAAESRMAT